MGAKYKGPQLDWDDLVILYLYVKKSAWFKDITRNVTGHDDRTNRVLKRLIAAGLVDKKVKTVNVEGTPFRTRISLYYLTPIGVQYAKQLLEKCKGFLKTSSEEK